MEESCILTYKKPQKLRLLKSNIPPSQVKSTRFNLNSTGKCYSYIDKKKNGSG